MISTIVAAGRAVRTASVKAAGASSSGAVGMMGTVACHEEQHSQTGEAGANGSAAALSPGGVWGWASDTQHPDWPWCDSARSSPAKQPPHQPDGKAKIRLQRKASGWSEQRFIELPGSADEPFYASRFAGVSEIQKFRASPRKKQLRPDPTRSSSDRLRSQRSPSGCSISGITKQYAA